MDFNSQLISSVKIRKLFGLYDYDLPIDGELSGASIIYGDNGVGKSTLLRLVFHLLSSSNSNGHRNSLFTSVFYYLEVILSSGYKLTAEFQSKNSVRILSLKIYDREKLIADWDYTPKADRSFLSDDYELEFQEIIMFDGKKRMIHTKKSKSKSVKGEKNYIEILRSIVPVTFILNADRRLSSDSISDPSDEVELRKVLRFKEPKDLNELVSRTRELAVSQALNRAGAWFSRKAFQGTNQGADNVHSVYAKVLKQLVAEQTVKNINNEIEIINSLENIQSRSKKLAEYELATVLDMSEFKSIISKKNELAYSLATDILATYIESLESRLDAVTPIYNMLDKFVSIINGLLRDKVISFKLGTGFYIVNMNGDLLLANQLSSGEQQLILLFCYVIVARDQPSIFMIDEPEISLNIKWQRKLVQTLLDMTDGENVQFIFASHSMELLAQHRDKVVIMTSKGDE
ncbi:AAA family ATPase [Pantoea agglomerans]|uniref:AAA family ATPase n=2 Tax=Bacteria TaxID=2 RepID=UPI003CF1DA3D